MILDKFTIATTNTQKMVQFYNEVFSAALKPIPDTPIFVGQLAEMTLMFCPNEIVGIKAEKNRIQMRFRVDNLDEVIQIAQEHGGNTYGDREENDQIIAYGISDPDGNSIELLKVK